MVYLLFGMANNHSWATIHSLPLQHSAGTVKTDVVAVDTGEKEVVSEPEVQYPGLARMFRCMGSCNNGRCRSELRKRKR